MGTARSVVSIRHQEFVMSIQLNAETIFEIGVNIEKNGKAFYLEAAKKASDAKIQTLFTELANWEDKHITIFQQLQAELPENAREDNFFDPENELVSYLQAAADSHVFATSINAAKLAEQHNTPVEALNLALTFEKDSVVYYTTMKKVVSEHLGRQKVDLLIDEELQHIAILHAKKKELERSAE